MQMEEKDRILDSWITVEQLSEGDIKTTDRTLKKIENLGNNDDFYSLFKEEIKVRKLHKYQKSGIVLYFNIFAFSEVIAFLRERYNLPECYEEVSSGDKFSFALHFDKDLKLAEEMTFFTVSYYILQNENIPNRKEFLNFEYDNKKYINSIFECPEEVEYSKFFNNAIIKLMNKFSLQLAKSRMKVLKNIETDVINLHSFFIDDLEKAKDIKNVNLDRYLLGRSKERINLNSNKNTQEFNPEIFRDILQPKNYPVSRYPSNPSYSLSFMQQVAVNLVIGDKNNSIQSVNGPPGTGKTTLLKDIFAELVVEQANEIIQLSNRNVSSNDKLEYFKNAFMGIVPKSIADKEIIVASSNNGAVQNIVNELPLISKIDEKFIDDLKNADYFGKIANSTISSTWEKDENGKAVEILKADPCDDEQYWGLFSLEGGKKDNIDSIITAVKHVIQYLEKDYVSDSNIYSIFAKKYKKIYDVKQEMQIYADSYKELSTLQKQICAEQNKNINKRKELERELEDLENNYSIINQRLHQELLELEHQISANNGQVEKNNRDKDYINQAIDTLKLKKTSWLKFKEMQQYKAQMHNYSNMLLELLEKDRVQNSIDYNLREKKENLVEEIKSNNRLLSLRKLENEQLIEEGNCRIQKLTGDLNKLIEILSNSSVQALDMNLEYEKLQFSNPWFDEKYRIMQSQIFIDALRVRKQFLYDNRKSIKAACIIWSKQKEYLDNKQVIAEAWKWINMVIPVISSTFASFSRMFSNLGKETIGYLFVDEAGQALPQAVVGAIYRSKKIIVVGDPEQIKPVQALDQSILGLIGSHYDVSKKYLSESSSVQTLIDDISKYGYYKDIDKWIGIPLWVHRRCKDPMFSISNEISYGGNMVQSNSVPGKSIWYDVKGVATDKYVKEQGDYLKKKISELIEINPKIIDSSQKDVVYVISPFKNVASRLSKELEEIEFTRFNKDGKVTNVGTVHTFQGKEADIVFLVLGCDQNNKGAASWAFSSENPNIMNVAATRAKEEFYIIGDYELFSSINSEVIEKTQSIIKVFTTNEKEHL